MYQQGMQINRVDEFQEVFLRAWNEIVEDTLINLIKSMPKRCVEVLAMQGEKT